MHFVKVIKKTFYSRKKKKKKDNAKTNAKFNVNNEYKKIIIMLKIKKKKRSFVQKSQKSHIYNITHIYYYTRCF